MISPESYEVLPLKVSNLLFDVQNKIIADVARRINRMNKLSSTSEYQLDRLSEIKQFETNYRQELSTATGRTLIEIERLYEDAAQEAYIYDERLFEAKGIPMVPYSENLWLQQITQSMANQTKEEFTNLTQTIGFRGETGEFLKLRDFFVKKLDETEFIVSTGAMSYDQAIKDVVREMVESGLRTVKYEKRTDSVEVATRRAVMTGMGQISAQVSIKNITDLGVKHVQVSWHSTARTGEGINNHAGWQGFIYALNGFNLSTMIRDTAESDKSYKDFIDTTGYGDVRGLHGANCRHSFSGFDPEVQTPNYTPAELAEKEKQELKEKEFEFRDGTIRKFNRDQATQQMRSMEVAMKKQRALANGYKAGGNDEAYTSSKAMYRGQLAEYNKFAKSMGLQPEMQRVYVDGIGKL